MSVWRARRIPASSKHSRAAATQKASPPEGTPSAPLASASDGPAPIGVAESAGVDPAAGEDPGVGGEDRFGVAPQHEHLE